jgi:hypothetical protein
MDCAVEYTDEFADWWEELALSEQVYLEELRKEGLIE